MMIFHSEVDMNYGSYLMQLQLNSNRSKASVARAVGMNLSNYCKLLERDDIKISNFHRICKELGGSMADLDGDDYATDSRIKTTADSSTGI